MITIDRKWFRGFGFAVVDTVVMCITDSFLEMWKTLFAACGKVIDFSICCKQCFP